MKKIFLAFATMLFFICVGTQSSQAQLKRFSIGPFVEAGFPTGDFSKTHNTGYGIGIGADVKLVAGLTAVGSISYFQFGVKLLPRVLVLTLTTIRTRKWCLFVWGYGIS